MIFNKFRKILEFIASVFDNNDSDHSYNKEEVPSKIDNLEKRKLLLTEEKKQLEPKIIDWFKLDLTSQERSKEISIFKKNELTKIPTLKFLKQERIRKEKEKQLALESSLHSKLQSASQYVLDKNIYKAEHLLKQVQPLLSQTKQREIHEIFTKVHSSLMNLKKEIEEQERLRILEERKKQQEIERLRKETLERENREKEKRALEERKRREAENNKRILEAERKEKAEMAERSQLTGLCSKLKDDALKIKDIIKNERVMYFYHFTDIKNIPSIKRHGGLYSWYYCKTHNITIPIQGGDEKSKELDLRYGLEDYVRLSFCDDHPMAFRLQQNGNELVLLKIKIDVALFKETLFSDINAADKNHTHGGEYEDLQNINFAATKRHFVRHTDDDFKPHQAEVLVKTFIPLNYIVNINNPSPIN